MAKLNRRRFVTTFVPAALTVTALPLVAQASQGAERWLSFHSLNTGETMRATYRRATGYDQDGLKLINYVMRDWRSGEVSAMDIELLDFLYDLRASFGSKEPFNLISGFRSLKTNAMLASKSSGVGKKSLHMQGKAVDISLPGVDLANLHQEAKGFKAGGVGKYDKSGFIHVDTGRVRYW